MMEFIVEKIGMSREIGVKSRAVTLLKLRDLKVCELLDSNQAIVAYSHGKKMSKTIEGQQKKYKLSKEFNRFATLLVSNEKPGDVDLAPIEEAQKNSKSIKISFTSKGRGFSGVVKRWNFAGGSATHGSRMHRAGGSIGNCEWPGRVQKGRKMAGQYGNETVTVKNTIISFEPTTNVVVVKGSVPGSNGSIGKLRID